MIAWRFLVRVLILVGILLSLAGRALTIGSWSVREFGTWVAWLPSFTQCIGHMHLVPQPSHCVSSTIYHVSSLLDHPVGFESPQPYGVQQGCQWATSQ